MITAKTKHTKVFGEKMDSPNKYQLRTLKTSMPALEPINLADHTELNSCAASFQACQKDMLVGTPKRKDTKIYLPSHHSDRNWEFN